MMPRFLKIALLLGTDLGYCRGVLRGVQQYRPRGQPWVFHDAPPELDVLPSLMDWRPDGLITHLFRPEVAEAVLRLKRPVVNTTDTLPNLNVPLVEVDHFAVGVLAAEHFLERGFRQFGFLGNTAVGFAQKREQGFRDRLNQAGFTSSTCHAEFFPRLQRGTSWKAIDSQVRKWILAQPKPVAVLASNDVPARELANVCRQLGLNIPEAVAVLGVDNDELECSLAFPPLSSIQIPAEQIGFRAAEILDHLLTEPRAARKLPPTILPPLRVITRQSTDILALDDPELAAAIRHIQKHACAGLRVQQLLAAIPMARRTLEKRFHDVLGRSPHEEICRVQVKTAQELLATSNDSITRIALRAGFSTSQRLAVVFRRHTGLTCRAYREQARSPRPTGANK